MARSRRVDARVAGWKPETGLVCAFAAGNASAHASEEFWTWMIVSEPSWQSHSHFLNNHVTRSLRHVLENIKNTMWAEDGNGLRVWHGRQKNGECLCKSVALKKWNRSRSWAHGVPERQNSWYYRSCCYAILPSAYLVNALTERLLFVSDHAGIRMPFPKSDKKKRRENEI